MTTQQAAQKLGIKVQQLRRHIKAGRIQTTWKQDPGGRPYRWITMAALKEFRAIRRKPGNPNWAKEK